MKRLIVVCLLAIASLSSAQGARPRTRPAPIVIPPPCDVAKLIDLLDEFYVPTPPAFPLPPEYCAQRTCEAREKAARYAKDAALLQSIDLMRQACRVYYPS